MMLINIATLVFGALVAVFAFLMRKKLPRSWLTALFASALAIMCLGGGLLWRIWQQQQQDARNVYIALRYMEYGRVDQAAYYLRKPGKDTFDSLAAEIVLETARDNQTLARMKHDSLQGTVKNDTQRALSARLETLRNDDYDAMTQIIAMLENNISLSKKEKRRADAQFSAESGTYIENAEAPSQVGDEQEVLRQQVNASLSNGSYSSAVQQAARLVDQAPSSQNRLLLAESIAECVYNGNYLTGWEFESDAAGQELSAERERAKLQEQIDSLDQEIQNAQSILDTTTAEKDVERYSKKKEDLLTQRQEVQSKYDYMFAYRAFSSIADLHSLDAAIVRARLYFAMHNYSDAVAVLQNAANSFAGRTTPNMKLRNALTLLNETYASDQVTGVQSPEFGEAINTLLSPGAVDLVGVSASVLTKDFVNYIISEQRSYGKDLYVTDVDLENYPQVVVTLAGRDTAKEYILGHEGVTVHDTHTEVEYTAEEVGTEEQTSNICVVVDESGSMSGEPINNLKSALYGFVESLDDHARVALVGFEDSGSLRAAIGTDRGTLLQAIDDLHASGGTNITSGISTGLQACEGVAGHKTMLLMTDGQSNIDMDVVQQAADTGMTIHTIGFGSVDDTLLQNIADATGGQYIRAETSSELISVYRSLVGMIGNEIRIHYTAKEVEDEQTVERYFFIRLDDQNISARVEYSLPTPVVPALYMADPYYIDEEQQAQALERGEQQTLVLRGQNLNRVAAVNIGGQAAAVTDQQNDTISLTLAPTLARGWQTIELTDNDGNAYSFEHLLCVGTTLGMRSFQLGALRIDAYNSALLDNNTLVLSGNITVSDRTDTDAGTLEMVINGGMTVPVEAAAVIAHRDEQGAYTRYVLGDTGTLECAGIGSITYNDSAYDGGTDPQIAHGLFVLEYDGTQARLYQK